MRTYIDGIGARIWYIMRSRTSRLPRRPSARPSFRPPLRLPPTVLRAPPDPSVAGAVGLTPGRTGGRRQAGSLLRPSHHPSSQSVCLPVSERVVVGRLCVSSGGREKERVVHLTICWRSAAPRLQCTPNSNRERIVAVHRS